MTTMHRHALMIRVNVSGMQYLAPIGIWEADTEEPLDRFIQEADQQAKALIDPNHGAKHLNPDAVFYTVNGKTEYFISKYFYLWPNYTDREERKHAPRKTRKEA